MENYFKVLNGIDVSEKTEEKNKLTYLSWAWAWGELKKQFPDAQYKVERFGESNSPYLYDENLGYMVFTSVTVNGLTHEMWLPVMDGANKAMKDKEYTYEVNNWVWNKTTKRRELQGTIEKTVEPATMFDINKTIMRCLVKNIGMHGLGLYIYAGEDLPESVQEEQEQQLKQIEENKKYQKMIVSMFNDLVKEHGTADKVYEVLITTREKYIALYNENPKELWEFMQSNA